MLGDFDFWTEAGGTLVAAALIPFYIGFLHLTLGQLLLYCAVAGAGLTIGEHLRFSGLRLLSLSALKDDFLLWGAMVLGVGLASYLVALIAV